MRGKNKELREVVETASHSGASKCRCAGLARLRCSEGKKGEGKAAATVALTLLFGPIGLIKHGKNVEIPAGRAPTAFVERDYMLPAAK